MTPAAPHACPLCAGPGRPAAFPRPTRFAGQVFEYFRCGGCRTVFVRPVPDARTFELMYAKDRYHDVHYVASDDAPYVASARLLARHVGGGRRVLDYGCGAGQFLRACAAAGMTPVGVDFEPAAAQRIARALGCEAMSVAEFEERAPGLVFDAVHLGDVLEHTPDPHATLASLTRCLREGGVLFVEGPIEENPSPVYAAARLFGSAKAALRPGALGSHPPTHLFRADAAGQRAFFERAEGTRGMSFAEWRVEETGWPYAQGGAAQRVIAAAARALGGRTLLGVTFGNRFKAILVKRGEAAAAPAPRSAAQGS